MRRGSVPCAVVVVLVVLLATLTSLAQSPPARAATSVGSESGVAVTLDEISPVAPGPGDTLVVRGTVRNATAAELDGGRVRLRVSQQPLRARSQVAAMAKGRGVRNGTVVRGSTVELPDVLPAGSRAPFSISVPVGDLGLGGFGVYPLNVEVRGALTAGGDGQDQTQALLPTFLPWSPPGSNVRPTSLVWLWPLTGLPARLPGGQVADPRSLAAALAPSGRLGRIVAAGTGADLTWVVDPDLLQTVQQVAGSGNGTGTGGTGTGTGGTSSGSGTGGSTSPTDSSPTDSSSTDSSSTAGTPTSAAPTTGAASTPTPTATGTATATEGQGATVGSPGAPAPTGSAGDGATPGTTPFVSGSASPTPSGTPSPPSTNPDARTAASWLDALRAALNGSPVMLTPYADPDLVAVHRAGQDEDLRAAVALGRQLGAQLLGVPVDAGLAWPAQGLLPASLIPTLAQLGMNGVVLAPGARALTSELTYTPNGRVALDSGSAVLNGYVADGELTSLVMAGDRTAPDTAARPSTGADSAATGPLSVGQQTLLVQQFLAETALVTAERPGVARTVLVAPSRDWDPSLTYVTHLLQALGQAGWVHLAPLSALTAAPVDPQATRAALAYPESARRAELPSAYLGAVADLESQLDTLSAILTRPQQLVPAYRQSLLELESTAWRNLPHARVQAVGAVAEALAKLRHGVSLTVPQNVTTGSQGATLPVTITNVLGQPVQVRLGLTPDNPRLVVEPTQVLTIAAGRRQQVNVPVTALANGLVRLQAQLLTPAGIPLTQPVTVSVRVTQIGAVALALIAGLAALAFLVGILRLVRRLVIARHREQDEARRAAEQGPDQQPSQQQDQQPSQQPDQQQDINEGTR